MQAALHGGDSKSCSPCCVQVTIVLLRSLGSKVGHDKGLTICLVAAVAFAAVSIAWASVDLFWIVYQHLDMHRLRQSMTAYQPPLHRLGKAFDDDNKRQSVDMLDLPGESSADSELALPSPPD